MAVKAAYFLSLMLLALALGASLAHLYALPNKMELSRDAYLAAQRAYDGWALLGVVVIGTLVAVLALVVLLRGRGAEFWLALAALACVAGTQAIFWTHTWPANQATKNWTVLPENWIELRRVWEHSHAVGAVLNIAAFALLVLALLAGYRESGS
jgi:hypothetical protein